MSDSMGGLNDVKILSGFNSKGESIRELTSTYYAQAFMDEAILDKDIPVPDIQSRQLADEVTKILLSGGEVANRASVFDAIERLREEYGHISEGTNTRKLSDHERYDIMIDRITSRMFADMFDIFKSYGDGKIPTRKQVETWVRRNMVKEIAPEFGIYRYFVRVDSFNPFVFIVSDHQDIWPYDDVK